MIILSRGQKQEVIGGNNPITFQFQASSPITNGELIYHNLHTLTPSVTAVDSNGNLVNNLSVTPVLNHQFYAPEDLSKLVYSGSFIGTITLTTI